MKKSEYNKMVIENFILHFTGVSRNHDTEGSQAFDLYEALDNYIQEDWTDGIDGDKDYEIDTLLNSLDGEADLEAACIKYLESKNIFFSAWSLSDIFDVAEEMEIEISEAQAIEVKNLIIENHDANEGINYEVIKDNILTVTSK